MSIVRLPKPRRVGATRMQSAQRAADKAALAEAMKKAQKTQKAQKVSALQGSDVIAEEKVRCGNQ